MLFNTNSKNLIQFLPHFDCGNMTGMKCTIIALKPQ